MSLRAKQQNVAGNSLLASYGWSGLVLEGGVVKTRYCRGFL